MAKKNFLKEIKSLETSKSKQAAPKVPKPLGSIWEAWECRGDEDSSECWYQVWQGSFEDCYASVEENVKCQVEDIINRDGSIDALIYKYGDDDHEKLSQILEALNAPRTERIKQDCLLNGGYRGFNWALALTSQSARFRPPKARGGIFLCSNSWAGFELAKNRKDSRCYASGSLDECIYAMGFFINIEIERATEGELTDDIDIGEFVDYRLELRSQLIEEVRQTCLVCGEYEGRGWAIQSKLSQEDCWAIVRSGASV